MGLPTPSVGPQIAECQRVLENSGLEYRVSKIPTFMLLTLCSFSERMTVSTTNLSGYGTNVEGPWDKVMEVGYMRPSRS